jgi:hypothetical protein
VIVLNRKVCKVPGTRSHSAVSQQPPTASHSINAHATIKLKATAAIRPSFVDIPQPRQIGVISRRHFVCLISQPRQSEFLPLS